MSAITVVYSIFCSRSMNIIDKFAKEYAYFYKCVKVALQNFKNCKPVFGISKIAKNAINRHHLVNTRALLKFSRSMLAGHFVPRKRCSVVGHCYTISSGAFEQIRWHEYSRKFPESNTYYKSEKYAHGPAFIKIYINPYIHRYGIYIFSTTTVSSLLFYILEHWTELFCFSFTGTIPASNNSIKEKII